MLKEGAQSRASLYADEHEQSCNDIPRLGTKGRDITGAIVSDRDEDEGAWSGAS